MRRNDPIADLIGPSPRIAAVQRALSDYGYGQIKPSGMLDDATSAAIEKFERERKIAGHRRVSDRLVRELAAMVGHPLRIAICARFAAVSAVRVISPRPM